MWEIVKRSQKFHFSSFPHEFHKVKYTTFIQKYIVMIINVIFFQDVMYNQKLGVLHRIINIKIFKRTLRILWIYIRLKKCAEFRRYRLSCLKLFCKKVLMFRSFHYDKGCSYIFIQYITKLDLNFKGFWSNWRIILHIMQMQSHMIEFITS